MASEIKRFQRAAATTDTRAFYLGDDLFHAVWDLPGGRILDFAALTSVTPEKQALMTQAEIDALGSQSMEQIADLFEVALIPNDRQRWAEAIRKPLPDGSTVTLAVLMEIAGWLIGEYAGNPTGESSQRSSSGAGGSGGSSGGAPSGASTYSRPAGRKRSR